MMFVEQPYAVIATSQTGKEFRLTGRAGHVTLTIEQYGTTRIHFRADELRELARFLVRHLNLDA